LPNPVLHAHWWLCCSVYWALEVRWFAHLVTVKLTSVVHLD
jgi:hypothetical protein